MSVDKIRLKLFVDNTKHTILFAEAEKECVDFLFHILSLPLATVVGYLTKESMVGCVGNLYGSFESLSVNYVQEGLNKDCLLKLKPAANTTLIVPLLANNPVAKKFYVCPLVTGSDKYGGSSHMYVSDTSGVYCPDCKVRMTKNLSYVCSPPNEAKMTVGYVKGAVSYMIMDDLSVKPMSMMSITSLLNKNNVRDVGVLEEKVVTLDIKLGIALLKASVMSKTVLTDVFLGENEEVAA